MTRDAAVIARSRLALVEEHARQLTALRADPERGAAGVEGSAAHGARARFDFNKLALEAALDVLHRPRQAGEQIRVWRYRHSREIIEGEPTCEE